MKLKALLKKIWIKLSPTYRKLYYIEKSLNKNQDETVRALDATTNQCWSIRHQTLQLKQQVDGVLSMRTQIDSLKNQITEINKTNKKIQTMLWYAIRDNKSTLSDSQKTFWKNYPKATSNMRLVQTANLFMMEALKKICDQNNLKFWLHGGTLIGAIRHNGFIPWDDDVDVAMTRADLEALIDLLKNNKRYSDFTIDILYHDDSTISRGYQFKYKNGELPNYIDIFIFDKCEVGLTIPEINTKLENIRSVRRNLVKDYQLSPRKIIVEDIGYWHFGPAKATDKDFIDDFFNKHLSRLGNVYKGNAYYYSIENYPFPYPVIVEDRMFPLQTILFEEREFFIPADPEFYLDGYGDIWQVPSDIEKHPHLYFYEPYFKQIENYLEIKKYKI